MDQKMNSAFSKIVNNLADDIKSTFQDFAMHLAQEWEIDESRIPNAVASFKMDKNTKNKNKKTKKDPFAPKGTKSAFIFFSLEHRKQLAEDGLDFSEISKKISVMWKEISEKEKKKFQKLADEDKVRYEKEMEEFDPTSENRTQQKKIKGMENAREKTKKEGKIYYYNLSTSRTIPFDTNKPNGRVFDETLNVCAKTQEELDEFANSLSTEKEEEEEISELSSEEEVVLPKSKKN